MAYCTYTDVYRTSGLDTTAVSAADVTAQILQAENIICRLTKNIYWNREVDTQLATAGAASSITKTGAAWVVNAYANMYVWVYSGTGSEQIRKIVSNTTDTLTVDRAWTTTNPDNTSYFRIFYVPTQFNPYVSDSYDGNDQTYFYLPYYPVNKIETLSIQSTSVTISSGLYTWKKTGRIQLKSGSEYGRFTSNPPQGISITYWYGVDFLPYEVKRLVEIHAAIQIMGAQMGGTYDDPSLVTLPEATISIGQAYINIKSSLDILKAEYDDLMKSLIKVYPVFG